jgi:hypothetical protein
MTYEQIYQLRFRERVPTFELTRRFPREARKIAKVALLQLPRRVLRDLIKQEKEFRELMELKKFLFRKNSRPRKIFAH